MDKPLFRRLFSRTASSTPETLEAMARRGDVDAQFRLGLTCANGEGAALDYVQAAHWYLKAAEQSHALAQFNLGVMYAKGQGMPSDEAKSMMWMQKAANLGDPGAQHALGIARHRASLGDLLEHATESRIEAYKWLQLAATQGYQNSDTALDAVTLQMSKEDVADGNRRAVAFVCDKPGRTRDSRP